MLIFMVYLARSLSTNFFLLTAFVLSCFLNYIAMMAHTL